MKQMSELIKEKITINKLLMYSMPKFCHPETILIKQGDEADNFYILASGECHVLISFIQKIEHKNKIGTFIETLSNKK